MEVLRSIATNHSRISRYRPLGHLIHIPSISVKRERRLQIESMSFEVRLAGSSCAARRPHQVSRAADEQWRQRPRCETRLRTTTSVHYFMRGGADEFLDYLEG